MTSVFIINGFLDSGKTERECAREAMDALKAAGYDAALVQDIVNGMVMN